jgi:hypothetical protein
MAGLPGKVKNALDEARILVLGAQVLLGFQYRGFFEKKYEQLGSGERTLQIAGLFLLLVTVGSLFLIAARHRVVEKGRATSRFHRFTMAVMRFTLFPFALALSCDLAIAGYSVGGKWTGAVSGTLAFVAAIAFWYGPFAVPHKQRAEESEEHMEDTPLDQRIVEVLTEARVLLPGAQALLGFQLAIVLMETFEKLPGPVQIVHLLSLGLVALATMVLMAPAAYHRIVESGRDTERFHDFASRMLLIALALLAPGFSGDIYVVLIRAGHPRAALPVALLSLLIFYAAWFGAMILLRRGRTPALRRRAA